MSGERVVVLVRVHPVQFAVVEHHAHEPAQQRRRLGAKMRRVRPRDMGEGVDDFRVHLGMAASVPRVCGTP
jgi:hypothetical protein